MEIVWTVVGQAGNSPTNVYVFPTVCGVYCRTRNMGITRVEFIPSNMGEGPRPVVLFETVTNRDLDSLISTLIIRHHQAQVEGKSNANG